PYLLASPSDASPPLLCLTPLLLFPLQIQRPPPAARLEAEPARHHGGIHRRAGAVPVRLGEPARRRDAPPQVHPHVARQRSAHWRARRRRGRRRRDQGRRARPRCGDGGGGGAREVAADEGTGVDVALAVTADCVASVDLAPAVAVDGAASVDLAPAMVADGAAGVEMKPEVAARLRQDGTFVPRMLHRLFISSCW
ncbi:unnamed protein product, partial [Urochloa humidicola]